MLGICARLVTGDINGFNVGLGGGCAILSRILPTGAYAFSPVAHVFRPSIITRRAPLGTPAFPLGPERPARRPESDEPSEPPNPTARFQQLGLCATNCRFQQVVLIRLPRPLSSSCIPWAREPIKTAGGMWALNVLAISPSTACSSLARVQNPGGAGYGAPNTGTGMPGHMRGGARRTVGERAED